MHPYYRDIWNKADQGCNIEDPNMSRDEYTQKLSKWLEDARLWQTFSAGFPYFYSSVNNISNPLQDPLHIESIYAVDYPFTNQLRRRIHFSNRTSFPIGRQRLAPTEFEIPPVWKRALAEFIDFTILLFIKLTLTFIFLDMFNFMYENTMSMVFLKTSSLFFLICRNLDNYSIESFQKNLQDPEKAMQISIELITLDLSHKAIVCLYEAYYLKGGMCATPGKKFMGIMVIYIKNFSIPPHRNDESVISAPGCTALGWKNALLRAVLKNLIISLVLPLCSMYMFRFNRTGYDMMSNSIVVEQKGVFLNDFGYYEDEAENDE